MHRPRQVRRSADTLMRMTHRSRAARAALATLALVLTLGACSAPAASFDPTGPCSGDGATPGAYPELEALIPKTYHDAAPELLDSGRNCTPENLGSLASAG